MKPSRPVLIAALVVGASYLASLVALYRIGGSDGLIEALFELLVLVVAFPLLGWATTRRQSQVRPPAPRTSASPTATLLFYLAAFAALVLGWGFSALDSLPLAPKAHDGAKLVLKLLTMVALPLLLFGRPWQRMRPTSRDRRANVIALIVLAVALSIFQAIFGRGLQTLGALHPGTTLLLWAAPACLLWQIVEAGLCEEVLFRRVLQERLAGATGSQVAAVLWSTLLFGLAHAPGLWLRGGHLMEGVAVATPGWALAYSVAMIAPAGVLFGVVWARTRCLWLVVLLHGAADLLPQLAPFLGTWAGLVAHS